MMQGTCKGCGCQDLSACWDEDSGTPCFWVQPDLCSRCASKVTDEDMALVDRLSLLNQAMLECLADNRGVVLVVMQSVEDSRDLRYIASMDADEVQSMLRFLADSAPITPSVSIDIDLDVKKTVGPPGVQGPSRN